MPPSCVLRRRERVVPALLLSIPFIYIYISFPGPASLCLRKLVKMRSFIHNPLSLCIAMVPFLSSPSYLI